MEAVVKTRRLKMGRNLHQPIFLHSACVSRIFLWFKNKPEPSSEGQCKEAPARKKHQHPALHLKSLSTTLLLVVPGQANPHPLPVAWLDTCHRVTRSLGHSWCAPTAQSSYRWPWPTAKAHSETTRNTVHSRTKTAAKLELSGKCLTQPLLCCAQALRHLCIPHLVTLLRKVFSAASSKQQRLQTELKRHPSISGVLRASN